MQFSTTTGRLKSFGNRCVLGYSRRACAPSAIKEGVAIYTHRKLGGKG